jgi:hypothetical protein
MISSMSLVRRGMASYVDKSHKRCQTRAHPLSSFSTSTFPGSQVLVILMLSSAARAPELIHSSM